MSAFFLRRTARHRKGLSGLWLLSECAELDSEDSSRRAIKWPRPENCFNQAQYPICTIGVTIAKFLYTFINPRLDYSNKQRSQASLIMGYILA